MKNRPKMKKLLISVFSLIFLLPLAHAQEKEVHVRYNEDAQKLVVNEPGYLVLSYDMYLYPVGRKGVVGPCTYDYNKDDQERMIQFYQQVNPGDKVVMKNIRVLNMATKRAEKVKDYAITLR